MSFAENPGLWQAYHSHAGERDSALHDNAVPKPFGFAAEVKAEDRKGLHFSMECVRI